MLHWKYYRPCLLETERIAVYILCILLKSKQFDPNECVCLCWVSSGPSGFERKGHRPLTEWVPVLQEVFGAYTVLRN
jgi:hypothetical protein